MLNTKSYPTKQISRCGTRGWLLMSASQSDMYIFKFRGCSHSGIYKISSRSIGLSLVVPRSRLAIHMPGGTLASTSHSL
jgi:hypothetical protein